MKNENEFTGWIIRFGGLVPSFYINDGLRTCHPSDAKIFMHRAQAEDKANELQKQYSCGVSVKKAD